MRHFLQEQQRKLPLFIKLIIKIINKGEMGEITKILQDKFYKIVQERIKNIKIG